MEPDARHATHGARVRLPKSHVIRLGASLLAGAILTGFALRPDEQLSPRFNHVMLYVSDLDPDDDGILEIEPWDGVVDQVGVLDGGQDDVSYAFFTLDPNLDGAGSPWWGASRIPDGNRSRTRRSTRSGSEKIVVRSEDPE